MFAIAVIALWIGGLLAFVVVTWAAADAKEAANPERFVKKSPTPPNKPTAVWINPPAREAQRKEQIRA